MKRWIRFSAMAAVLLLAASCATRYKAKPMPFRSPESYGNAVRVAEVVVAGRAFSEKAEAAEAFGFDIRGAGMLPVQVVFDNPTVRDLEIHRGQTFLEDRTGNLWSIMARDLAYERATRYAETHEMFKEGAYLRLHLLPGGGGVRRPFAHAAPGDRHGKGPRSEPGSVGVRARAGHRRAPGADRGRSGSSQLGQVSEDLSRSMMRSPWT